MINLAWIEKGANEKFAVGLEYVAPDLEAGETITDVSVSVIPTGLTVGTPVVDGAKVKVSIEGGTLAQTYRVQFRVTTSAGYVYEHPERDAILVRIV